MGESDIEYNLFSSKDIKVNSVFASETAGRSYVQRLTIFHEGEVITAAMVDGRLQSQPSQYITENVFTYKVPALAIRVEADYENKMSFLNVHFSLLKKINDADGILGR